MSPTRGVPGAVIAIHALTAFLSGAGVLVVEMTAPRALAPFFGQTQFVWTNVIGLILFALAIGNFLGGWLADRTASPAWLGSLLLGASALVAAAAFLPGPVARAILPARLPLEAAYSFLFKGSFVATLICFAPPVLLLGAVPPFLVRCATSRVEEVGRRAGGLYAASTLGSIVGAFLTSYVLLDRLGTRGALLLGAALLALAAIPSFFAARAAGRRAALLGIGIALAAGGTAAAAIAPSASAPVVGAAFGKLVLARESRYQHLEIRERDDLPMPARVLAIDEGLDSVQSVTPATGVLTGLYYDYFLPLALDVARAGRLRVAILGFGGGTYARQLLHFLSDRCELSIVGVELDPDVVGIARSELGLPDDPRLRIEVDLDARTFVDHSTEQFDVVLVDCYHRQSFLPPHVTSREFFASARNRLVPSGVLAINLFGYGARDPVVESVLATMQAGVGTRPVMCSLPRTANFLVYASRDGVPRLPQDWAMGGWPEECRDLGARLATPAQSFLHTAVEGATVFTDQGRDVDRLQVERLRRHAESLLEGAR